MIKAVNFTKSFVVIFIGAFLCSACSSPSFVFRENPAETSYRQGKIYYDQFKFREAKSSFDQALSADPNHKYALYYRGRSLNHLDRPSEAVGDFDRSLNLDGRFVLGFAGRAESHIMNRNFDRASMDIERALEINPSESEVWYVQGLSFGYQGRVDEAVKAFQKCLDLNPGHAYAQYQLGLAYNQLNKKDLAVLHLRKFLELAPNAPEAGQVRNLLNSIGIPASVSGHGHMN